MTPGTAEGRSPNPQDERDVAGKGEAGARLPAPTKRADRPLCGAILPYTGETCARYAGHAGGKGGGHRSRWVMDNDARARRGKWAAGL
jgi:hypothetical protein